MCRFTKLFFLLGVLILLCHCGIDSESPKTLKNNISHSLNKDQLAQYQELQEDYTFKRTLSTQFPSDLETYEFFLDRLVFLSHCLRIFEIRSYQVKAIDSKTFEFNDKRGLTGTMEQWGEGDSERIYKLWVTARGMGMSLTAQAQFYIFYRVINAQEMENQVQAWVKIDGLAGFIIKMIAPIAGDVFDYKLNQVISGSRQLAQLAYEDPQSFIETLSKSKDLDPKEVNQLKILLQKNSKLELKNDQR